MIVVPYTDLHPETKRALPDAHFVAIDDEDGYRNLLADLWREGNPFTLVEHDVVPTCEQLAALDDCSEPWCYYGYHPGHWTPVFGCVRFGRDLILGTQGVWADASWPWAQLDMKFATYARALGWKHHWHFPHVRHVGASFYRAGRQAEREEIGFDLSLHLLEREMRELTEATA